MVSYGELLKHNPMWVKYLRGVLFWSKIKIVGCKIGRLHNQMKILWIFIRCLKRSSRACVTKWSGSGSASRILRSHSCAPGAGGSERQQSIHVRCPEAQAHRPYHQMPERTHAGHEPVLGAPDAYRKTGNADPWPYTKTLMENRVKSQGDTS